LYKILGSVIILVSSTLVGLLVANKYKIRVKQLKDIRGNFQIIETEIFYTATPIIEVMEKISKQARQPLCKIYDDIAKKLKKREGESLGDIWKNAFERRKEYTCFTKEDLETINFFGSILGTTDRQSQVKNAKLVQSQLMKLEEHAEKDYIKNEKLFRNLGILLGLAIVIILL